MHTSSAELELVDLDGNPRGTFRIAALPSLSKIGEQHVLLHLTDDERGDLEAVQLLEGCEYVYSVDTDGEVSTDKPEILIADDRTGRRGRLRTKLYTGRVDIQLQVAGHRLKPFAFEIRSSKLSYLDDYRWMLEDIAELGTSLLLERFAPNAQRLAISETTDADTIYQRFVFLKGLLEGDRLSAGLRRVISEPYVQWARIEESVSPSRGMRAGGALLRELVRPGPRQEWRAGPSTLATLPRSLNASRTEETVDNVPNRFVLHALEEWRALVVDMLEALGPPELHLQNAAVTRGRREGGALLEHLDELIRAPLFAELGPLTSFPLANQVLQKKEGYREVLQAYLLVQMGAQLTWRGGDDVFSGGQRNVATLYEYWVFLELAKIVSNICHEPLNMSSLVGESSDGLQLLIRRETAHVLKGRLKRLGRTFDIELCFNQQFAKGPNGTWTKSLRPDCSLHIVPVGSNDDIWLHFDAKYRVSRVADIVGETEEQSLVAKTEDLYKMHTYRDAILRAAGAYVVFPGTEALHLEQHDEILPSLGAFPLRPSSGGGAEGSAEIRSFIEKAFDHVSTQTTRHERSRYWKRQSVEGAKHQRARDATPFLERPPADTRVLLGYVKSYAHHDWITATHLYNLRADADRAGAVGLRGPELSVELLALYGQLSVGPFIYRVVKEPLLKTAAAMRESEYPGPRGDLYFCLQLAELAAPRWLVSDGLDRLAMKVVAAQRGAMGHPVVTDWATLMDEL